MTASRKPRKCMYCRQNQVVATVLPSYAQELEHDGRKYSVTLSDFHVLQCQNCHELVLDDSADERLNAALRSEAGLLTPAAIRLARESLGYTQQQLADYLRISMYTLSRWETGAQIQQRGMDALLRVFFESVEARRVLGVPRPDVTPAAGHESISRELAIPFSQ
jgi:putative zinc finger/helix-turn-helix YgiT family protein